MNWDDATALPYYRNDSDRNAYIEETLLCAVNGIAGVAPLSVERRALELNGAGAQLRVELRADNDFYSQVKRVS